MSADKTGLMGSVMRLRNEKADLTRALEESQAREAALRASRDHHKQLMLEAAEESNKLEKERDALRVQLAAVNDDNDALGDKLNAQDSALTESQAMVATLREALMSILCNLTEGRQLVAEGLLDRASWMDSMIRAATEALSSTAEAAKAHNERMRREALEEAATFVEAPPMGTIHHDHNFKLWGFTPGSFQKDLAAGLRALARDGKPPTP